MAKNNLDILSEINKISQKIESIDNKLSNDISDIKIILLSLDHKIGLVLNNMQELELIADSDDDHNDDNEYNQEWTPYDNYSEDYDQYDSYDENEDEDE